uniref:Uncharacterized protein n=1 Tax=Arundo donax TaxID=35708 RepID=A0A0A9BS20_ARUDO
MERKIHSPPTEMRT